MIEGTFPIDTSFFSNSCTTEIEAAEDEVPSSWVNLSDILREDGLGKGEESHMSHLSNADMTGDTGEKSDLMQARKEIKRRYEKRIW
ncbi:MAG TPA: hypothetical protein VN368_03260 [Candidatus Methylomirabilis sp.]|nr:hypothetical protein [Candidatus Methylomirabilis sp.]